MGKRASGEGNVRQRADGRWEARLSYVDPVTGRRRSASFYGATAEAVRAKLDKARDRVKVEAPVQDSTVRLSDWVEHWSTTHAGSVAAERVDQTAVPVAGAQAPDTGSVWRHPARQAA
jgi:hypothetical protein